MSQSKQKSSKKHNLKFKMPNQKYSVEFFSRNIIKSNKINTYLADGTNLIKNKSLLGTSTIALNKYFHKILNKAVSVKLKLSTSIEPLKPNHITFIHGEGDNPFLHSVENNLITLSYKTKTTLLDTLSISLGRDITKSEVENIENDLHKKFGENYTTNILNANIPDLVLPEIATHNYIIPKKEYIKLIDFYENLIKILSKHLEINILFYIPTIYISDPKLVTFYISDFKKEYNTIGIRIVIPYISPAIRNLSSDKSPVNKIYYENLCELNAKINTISMIFSEIITNKIKGELKQDILSVNETLNIGDEIVFNPLDREGALKIIEIEITKTKKKSFLLGNSGNLYEDDDDANDLVGNLVFINRSTFDARVYWCKGYLENILGN